MSIFAVFQPVWLPGGHVLPTSPVYYVGLVVLTIPVFPGEYWSSFYVDMKSWKLYFGVLWPRLPWYRPRPFPTTSNTCKLWPQWSCTWWWRCVTIPTSGFRDTGCWSISFESRYLGNRLSYLRDLFAVSYLSAMPIPRRGVLWPTSPRRRLTAFAVGVWRLRSRWVLWKMYRVCSNTNWV